MGYIILSRKQADGDLNVELVKDKASADLQRKQLIKQYNDVVILSEDDYNKLDGYEHSEYYYDTERNK